MKSNVETLRKEANDLSKNLNKLDDDEVQLKVKRSQKKAIQENDGQDAPAPKKEKK